MHHGVMVVEAILMMMVMLWCWCFDGVRVLVRERCVVMMVKVTMVENLATNSSSSVTRKLDGDNVSHMKLTYLVTSAFCLYKN